MGCDQGAIVMFGSYTLAGLLPLSPYLFAPSALRVPISVLASLLGLVLLGYTSAAWYGHAYPWRRAFKMVVFGGMAVGVGILVGSIFQV
jgi:VIT1/CCC1 family predicted Fe2+/Mn2+ transporter